MPQPTARAVHTDAILSNVSVAYVQSQDAYIASQVFPMVRVSKQSDKFYKYTKNDWFRDEAQLRAPASESAGSGYGVSTDTYSADVYAFHKDVPDQVAENTDVGLGDPEAEAARFVAQRMLLKHEIEWMTSFFTTGVWTGGTSADFTPSALWSDYGNSSPVRDIRLQKSAVLMNTGIEPNTLVLSYDLYTVLLDHPDFVDRIKNVSDAPVTMDIIKRLFEVDRIFVSKAIKATNNEGETEGYAPLATKDALLVYAAPNPSLMSPSGGYTFVWDGVSDGAGLDVGTVRIDMPLKRAVRIESQMAWDSKVVASDVGVFFNNAIA
jgi:hypothetical protein